jgi:hypothetical protein
MSEAGSGDGRRRCEELSEGGTWRRKGGMRTTGMGCEDGGHGCSPFYRAGMWWPVMEGEARGMAPSDKGK